MVSVINNEKLKLNKMSLYTEGISDTTHAGLRESLLTDGGRKLDAQQ